MPDPPSRSPQEDEGADEQLSLHTFSQVSLNPIEHRLIGNYKCPRSVSGRDGFGT